MPSSSTANSSPPRRATVSEERVVLTMRCATACSRRSPASWPRESLMFLKLSRSRNMTATEALAALRQRERVLHPVAEQVAVGEQRQRIVEGELAQLLLERLALADVAEVERQALHRRILRSGCCRRSRSRSGGCRARCAAPPDRRCRRAPRPPRRGSARSSLPVLPAPQVRQVLAGDAPRASVPACARTPARRSAAAPSAATIMMTSEALAISEA